MALRGPLRVRALVRGQAATMTQAAIAAQIHQTLDRHTHFTTQVTFDHEFADFGAQALHFRLR
jgi:hypothetical protein